MASGTGVFVAVVVSFVSFIIRKRLQKFNRMPKGFFKGSPDLAVEILSPSDTVEGVHGKIVEYFENDTNLAWVVNPEEQTVTVYHSSYPHKLLTNKDTLEGEGVLEGFSVPVARYLNGRFNPSQKLRKIGTNLLK